ncbi:TetR/AcrR family transcriptional regulator [Labedaea rhizosphaerae]|uniref:TetR family transcriptional regulator n=1 Tax=Labedaea rhizosphaerae TaxID=598644 RepID=A0A4R6SCN1_LABRH|nr:TetR/AcrR family transcriptional regulator [Labedaea rhizosphaerae]TDP97363.1 TetR family transcriptional regulator [Labedaea rhizosphaerae]
MGTPPEQTRGRKRSEQTRLAILTAAYELTTEVGYQDLTIEGIAARAGSGKQTVYRWWSTKADVLLEALALKADLSVTTADQGSFADDVGAFLRDSAVLLARPGVVAVLRSLMSEAQRDQDFRDRFQREFLHKRRGAIDVLVTRAARRGDKPAFLSADLCADLIFGLIWYRVLATEPKLTDQDIAALQRLLS